jgi:preprotein translocase subunit SecE
MNARVESPSARLDGVKWAAAVILLGAAIAGFYYFGDTSLLLRVVALLAAGGVALAILSLTEKGREAWAFMREARTEVRKVVWPTRKETVQTTSIIVVMVAIVAVFLWLIDMLLAWGVQRLIGQGG